MKIVDKGFWSGCSITWVVIIVFAPTNQPAYLLILALIFLVTSAYLYVSGEIKESDMLIEKDYE